MPGDTSRRMVGDIGLRAGYHRFHLDCVAGSGEDTLVLQLAHQLQHEPTEISVLGYCHVAGGRSVLVQTSTLRAFVHDESGTASPNGDRHRFDGLGTDAVHTFSITPDANG